MSKGKFVVLVHDKREGTYSYRGTGTKEETVEDVNVLIEEKNIPGRRIEVVPVKGEPRPEITTPSSTSESGTGKTILVTAIVTASLLIGGFIGWKYYKKRKKEVLKK